MVQYTAKTTDLERQRVFSSLSVFFLPPASSLFRHSFPSHAAFIYKCPLDSGPAFLSMILGLLFLVGLYLGYHHLHSCNSSHQPSGYEKVPLFASNQDAGNKDKEKPNMIPCLVPPPCLLPVARIRGVLSGRVLKARGQKSVDLAEAKMIDEAKYADA